jgi:hypothetical protein
MVKDGCEDLLDSGNLVVPLARISCSPDEPPNLGISWFSYHFTLSQLGSFGWKVEVQPIVRRR